VNGLGRATLLGLLAAAAPLPVVAAPEVFDLDPAHTFVHFEVLHFGTSTCGGAEPPLSGVGSARPGKSAWPHPVRARIFVGR
jgi:polyisoprenoid-binding protein YceI